VLACYLAAGSLGASDCTANGVYLTDLHLLARLAGIVDFVSVTVFLTLDPLRWWFFISDASRCL